MYGTRIASVLAAAGVIALAGAGPAAAAASSGADVYQQDGCVDYGYLELCGTIQSTINVVNTPSGRAIMHGNSTFDTTTTYEDGAWISRTGSYHYHSIAEGQRETTYIYHLSEVYADSLGNACTGATAVHFTNGEFQFNEGTMDCA